MSWSVAAVSAGLVAIACGAVSAAGWRALLRTGNSAIGLFVLAFALLGAKNVVKSAMAFADAGDSPALEAAFSVADVIAVGLVAWPLLARSRSP